MKKIISPARKISGEIELFGDKSISHRALMLAAIADGVSKLKNLSRGKDVRSTMSCLKQLGIEIVEEGDITYVRGAGLQGLKQPAGVLDVGNSGTTVRLLSGILAGQKFTLKVTGDESIRRRPMARIIVPLRKMGAHIEANNDEFVPLKITGGQLRPITYRLPMASAQVKSCLLFAGLYANGTTEITELAASRDHSEIMLKNFGALLEKDGLQTRITGPAELQAQNVCIPGDVSSAAFFIAAALLLENSQIGVVNVGINPTRIGYLSVLKKMDANLEIVNRRTINGEPVADIIAKSSNLRGTNISGNIIPQLIDEIPILAVLATQAEGRTEIRDAMELRVKETDRIHALICNLQRMGAQVEETRDGMVIEGPVKLKSAEVDSFGDHRIAMAFAIAGLTAGQEVVINNAGCVNVSFPGFFEKLEETIA